MASSKPVDDKAAMYIKISQQHMEIDSLKEQLASAKAFVKAMAHVGVDFGYGPYTLTETDICNARGFIEQLEGKG